MNNLPVPSGDPGYVMVDGMDEARPANSPFRIQRLLRFGLKFWWVPVLTLVLSLGAAAAYVWWMPPTFVSRASMWETVKLRLPEGSLFSEDVQNFVGTQSELLQSAALRDLAVARLKNASNHVAIPLGNDGQPLLVKIRVQQSAKSSFFTLEASGSNPAYTQAYLNALMQVYLEYKRDIRKVVSGDTLASITAQVQRTEGELKAEQDAFMAFQRTNNLAIMQEEGTIAGGYLARLKTQLSDLELEDRLAKASMAEQDGEGAGGTNASGLWPQVLSAISSSGQSSVPTERQTAFKEVEVLKLQKERLSKYLRPKHPKIVKLDADIQRGQKLLEIYRKQDRNQLVASQQATQLRIENVKSAIKEWEAKVVESNTRIGEAERLKLNVQRIQQVYDRLNVLVQNVGISRNIDQETLSVLEYASAPKRSYAQEMSLASMGGLGGLGLGVGIILLITLRDDRFGSVLEVVEKLGDDVMGQVPEVGFAGGKPTLLLENGDRDQRHIYAESFRNLRSALLFLAVEGQRPKVLLITSAMPDEGKSTIAASLARILALGGARVLLVDADLRKGSLHEVMGLQREPGLSELLREPDILDRVTQTNSLPSLRFISSGKRLDNPGDLFLGPALDQLLSRWRDEFDFVIIDSSPVFAADDATTLAPKVDGTLFVVRSRFSGARQVREALELLYRRQAKVLGLVFNRVDASARSYRYYKYAGYYPPAKAGD